MATPHFQPNEVIDQKWRIDRHIGDGGMGSVFAATHVRNGRQVALKVLKASIADDPQMRARFLTEGYAANQVGHPGTVQILDDGTAKGVPYLVMELLAGKPLDLLADENGGRLQVPLVASLGIQIMQVIAAAHRRGIVHRDIKPENVIVGADGVVKLLDFGIARMREPRGDGARLTATGVPMGTPAFMPPEQALAHWDEVDARSDVFSIGCTLFNLLSGRLLFEAKSVPELLVMVSTRQAPPVCSVLQNVPTPLGEVLDRALRFHRLERYRDAGAMLEAWTAACARLSLGGVVPPTSPAPSNELEPFADLATVDLEAAATSRLAPYGTVSGVTTLTAGDPKPGRLVFAAIGVGLLTFSLAAMVLWRGGSGAQTASMDAGTSADESALQSQPKPGATVVPVEPPASASASTSASARPSASVTATSPRTKPTAKPKATVTPTSTANPLRY